MKKETIGDIVRELRSRREFLGAEMSALADRIEAAYKDKLSEGKMCTMSCRESGKLLEQYADSEKKLVAKLKDLSGLYQRLYNRSDALVSKMLRECKQIRDNKTKYGTCADILHSLANELEDIRNDVCNESEC